MDMYIRMYDEYVIVGESQKIEGTAKEIKSIE